MAAAAIDRFGRIDALVNNAGIYTSLVPKPFEEIDAGRVAQRDGRQRARHVPLLPRGDAADEGAGRGADRQHRLRHAVQGRPVPAALRRLEGRGGGADACAGQGGRRRGRARQHGRAGLHDVRRRARQPGAGRGAAGDLAEGPRDPARPAARRTSSARSSSSAAPSPRSSPARRWWSTAARTSTDGAHRSPSTSTARAPAAERLRACARVVYVAEGAATVDGAPLEANAAWHGTGAVEVSAPGATLLRWELTARAAPDGAPLLAAEVDLDPAEEHLIRCDRVDFPPGGEALLHTHQGPGIRCLLFGTLPRRDGRPRAGAGPVRRLVRGRPEPRLRPGRRRRAGRLRAGDGAAAPRCSARARSATSATRTATGPRASATRSSWTSRWSSVSLEGAHRRASCSSTPSCGHGADLAFGVPGESYLAAARRAARPRRPAALRHLPPRGRRRQHGRGLRQADRPARASASSPAGRARRTARSACTPRSRTRRRCCS